MHTDIPKPEPDDPLGAYVAALLVLNGQLMGVVDHMLAFQASGRSAPDAPPIPVVLTELLTGILGPLAEGDGAAELELAAAMLEATSGRIASELFLVSPDLDEELDDEGWREAG
jgi:hypothetical protein